MASGLEIRAQIDTETVKALLLINGGGSIALLTFLSSIIAGNEHTELARAILFGVLILMVGLVAAVIHNRLRRKCSLHYEGHNMEPPKGRVLGIRLWAPTVCCASTTFMWVSIAAFFVAGSLVAVSGLQNL